MTNPAHADELANVIAWCPLVSCCCLCNG